MDRAQKQEAIETLKGVFDGAGAVVVTHYMGLTVAELTDLRGRLRTEGAKLQVVKNTLVQKALAGSVGEAGDALFKGPVAIAYAPDAVAAAKVTTDMRVIATFFSSCAGDITTTCPPEEWSRAYKTPSSPERQSAGMVIRFFESTPCRKAARDCRSRLFCA